MSARALAPIAVGRGGLRWVGAALRVVIVPFITARVVVLGALGVGHLVVDYGHPSSATVFRVHQGLLAWDAGFYESIARFGYRPFGHQALRFFPLLPLLGRGVGSTGIGDGPAVVLIANLGALIGTCLLVALVRRETGDEGLARRSAWLLSLAPPAFTFVLGYSEGLLLVFTTACFLCIRPMAGKRPAWWWAGAFGYLAALTRPLGILLAAPVVIEGWRHWRTSTLRERVGALLATVAPLAGMATFLGWSGSVYGDFFLPLRVQTSAGHHGGLSDPFTTLYHDADGALHHHVGTALHVPWVLLAAVLVVVVWRKLPASYGAFSTVVILAALSGTNLDSFERYALSAFPLVIVAAMALRRRLIERVVLGLSGLGLFGYALAAFLNRLVP